MEASAELERRFKVLNERLGRYIPPRDTWTPADESWQPLDLLRVPTDEALALQFRAIKHAFTRQYTLNDFYHRYCEKQGVRPDDLRTNADLRKIPLLPDVTFKAHPSGEDFAHWIANIYTGDLPTVVIDNPELTFDGIIDAFNAAGLVVAHSTGTSGRHSVIPRDRKTFNTFTYTWCKTGLGLHDLLGIDHTLSLFPRPTKTNLWAGKSGECAQEALNDHHYAIDTRITADQSVRAMTGAEQRESAKQTAQEQVRKIFTTGIEWLDRYNKSTDTISLQAPPALFLAFMDTLERMGKRYEFGERGGIGTGGGWKTLKNEQISAEKFRKRVEEVLGIPETRCFDTYGMVEMNSMLTTCSEGHYYHIPYTWLKSVVLDKKFEPVDYGEWGRFAFLDALAHSYPGFVMTGDQVRMLKHCPVCDRPGPVLDQAIQRMPSEEMRGCAEEVRRVFEQGIRKITGE